MKTPLPRTLLLGLLALLSAGTASAAQMKLPAQPAPASTFASAKPENPWPTLASSVADHTTPLLAHDDDRYWRDGRWHSHRDDWRRAQWRKEQWRREQHRREIERRRAWERHHAGPAHPHAYDDRRDYRR